MPRYEYFCPASGQSIIVRHCQSSSISTWGELCLAASTDVGSTPAEAAVEKRAQLPCTCGSNCGCHGDPHDHDQGHLPILSPDAALVRK
jgi:hypothetical protein